MSRCSIKAEAQTATLLSTPAIIISIGLAMHLALKHGLAQHGQESRQCRSNWSPLETGSSIGWVKKALPIRIAKARSLYSAGDPAKDVFLITEGFVGLVLPGMEKGRGERTVSVALPWELFGDEAFTEGHRRYGALAGSRCPVVALPEGRVLTGPKTAKKSLDAYLEGVERELHRLRHAQGGSRGPTATQRLAEVLLDLGQRCGERQGRGIDLLVKPTHQVLADLAGAHRATVTTLLNDWLYEGVLGASQVGGRACDSAPP